MSGTEFGDYFLSSMTMIMDIAGKDEYVVIVVVDYDHSSVPAVVVSS